MTHFYNSTTKTYIIAISRIFSDIHVKRYTSARVASKDIKVPLIYAPKRKVSQVLQQTADTASAGLVLPAMSFYIEGMQFDSERKMNSLNEVSVSSTSTMYEGIPYTYDFNFRIRTKYQDDYWQILEQVLYLFKPELSLDVKELNPHSSSYLRDVMVTLESVALDNDLELTQDEDSSREFNASLSCLLKGYVYPPVIEDENRIEHIDVNFINDIDAELENISHDWVGPDDDDIETTIT